jgi:anti-sigma factor ChrR (cupin superfamily)
MQEIHLNYEDIDWRTHLNSSSGLSSKILRNSGGAKTLFLKLPKGARIESHKHTKTEQHFIIEGEYETDEKVYGRGSYRLIPAGANHGPVYVKKELVILVI